MSYDTKKIEAGKSPVYFVEIYMDECSLTYGTNPCTATIGGDFLNKCCNTRQTCQDKPNYTLPDDSSNPGVTGRKVYRFSSVRIDQLQGPGEAPTFPTLISPISMAPTQLTPGQGLGVRSSVKINIQDMLWTGVGVDPYLEDRSFDYDDGEHGTFWTRWLAANKFYQGRTVIVWQGYADVDLNGNVTNFDKNDFRSRRYQIDRISGPRNGVVSIIAKDPLKFADNSRVKIPTVRNAGLRSDITTTPSVGTSEVIDVFDRDNNITDYINVGDTIRIDEELMRVTAVASLGWDAINEWFAGNLTVNRGQSPIIYKYDTQTETHDAEANMIHCVDFFNVRLDDLVYDLLSNYVGIDDFFLPTSEWQTVINAGYSNYRLSRTICEPIGVKDLLEEITQHNLLLWWDERAQEVKMDTLVPKFSAQGTLTDETDIIANSVSKTIDPEMMCTQVWLHCGIRQPLLDSDEFQSYEYHVIRADLDAESDLEYDTSRIHEIWSEWLPTSEAAVANEIASRYLSNYKETQDIISVSVDAKDDESWTGDVLEVKTYDVTDEFGNQKSTRYKILQARENLSVEGQSFSYELREQIEVGRWGAITPTLQQDGTDFPTYDNATEDQRNRYSFIADTATEKMSDDTSAYKII